MVVRLCPNQRPWAAPRRCGSPLARGPRLRLQLQVRLVGVRGVHLLLPHRR